MPATNPVESRHRIALNLPTEGQHLTSVCTELHVMHIYPTLNLPGLMRTLEVTSQNTSVLHNLNGLQRASRLIDIVGGPWAIDALHKTLNATTKSRSGFE
jgi:hypothetical protein